MLYLSNKDPNMALELTSEEKRLDCVKLRVVQIATDRGMAVTLSLKDVRKLINDLEKMVYETGLT